MCKESNNAPFAAGQKIIRIGNSTKRVEKGMEYTCHSCFQCGKCGAWKVNLLELPVNNENNCLLISSCACGYRNHCTAPYYNGAAKNFAPIDQQYTDICKEIADSVKETKETPDILKQPVLS